MQHRALLPGLLVLATALTAVTGMSLVETGVGGGAGIAVLFAAAPLAVAAWVALGAPITRKDMARARRNVAPGEPPPPVPD